MLAIKFKRLYIIFLLLSFFCFFYNQSVAQTEGLVGRMPEFPITNPSLPKNLHAKRAKKAETYRPLKKVNLPFFDNFAYNSVYPDTNLWYDDTTAFLSSVRIHRTTAINPPDVGSVVFDGRKSNGLGYRNATTNPIGAVPIGFADSLVTQCIDLSSLSPNDSVYLSFYYQPGGRGPMPSFNDSLVLYFLEKDTSGKLTFVPVWSAQSDTVPDTFRVALLAVDKASYFHNCFRFMFRNIARLNGGYDFWHLDYVYLNKKRSPIDSSFIFDRALVEAQRPILGDRPPYTALPRTQLSTAQFLPDVVQASTRGIATADSNLTATLRIRQEFVETEALSPLVFPLAAYDSLLVLNKENVLPIYSEFSPPYLTPPGKYGYLQYRYYYDRAQFDPYISNDTLTLSYRVDSLLAYDDSEAEEGYGVNSPRAFGQKFYVATPDSVRAIWMQFFSNGQIFDFKAFRLALWNGTALPTQILHEQFSNVNYGITENSFFVRYPIKNTATQKLEPIAVQDSFIVGVIQLDDKLLGVGYDFSYNNNARVTYDSAGVWRNSQLNGTLLIRPELTSGSVFSSRSTLAKRTVSLQLYPNPTQANHSIFLKGLPPDTYARIEWILSDATGRIIHQVETVPGTQVAQLQLPNITTGIYSLQTKLIDYQGKIDFFHNKIIIQN